MKQETYSTAYAKLEKLVERIESDTLPLDELADKVKQANELILFCETKLRTIEKEVNLKIR